MRAITFTADLGLTLQNSGTVTIAGEDARTNKGIASFSTDNFSVSSGSVTIKTGGVQMKLAGSIANPKLSHSTISVTTELTLRNLGDTLLSRLTRTDITINGTVTISAGSANKGVASFSTDNFSVTDGAVTIKNSGISNAVWFYRNAKLSHSKIAVTDGSNSSISLADTLTFTAGCIDITQNSGTVTIAGRPQPIKVLLHSQLTFLCNGRAVTIKDLNHK